MTDQRLSRAAELKGDVTNVGRLGLEYVGVPQMLALSAFGVRQPAVEGSADELGKCRESRCDTGIFVQRNFALPFILLGQQLAKSVGVASGYFKVIRSGRCFQGFVF